MTASSVFAPASVLAAFVSARLSSSLRRSLPCLVFLSSVWPLSHRDCVTPAPRSHLSMHAIFPLELRVLNASHS